MAIATQSTNTAVTIPSGTAIMAAGVNLGGATLIGIVLPAAWTAANLTFTASVDDSTYNEVTDSAGTAVSVTAAAARYIPINPATLPGLQYLKVRSGTAGVPVNQAADRILYLVTRVP
jgi:tryptophanyl-tRNA synthetase